MTLRPNFVKLIKFMDMQQFFVEENAHDFYVIVEQIQIYRNCVQNYWKFIQTIYSIFSTKKNYL
jgi:hypothetical protein